jgi:hypothetical protein
MNASFARRLERFQTALIALSAPTLLAEPKPLRPPVKAAPTYLRAVEVAPGCRLLREVPCYV